MSLSRPHIGELVLSQDHESVCVEKPGAQVRRTRVGTVLMYGKCRLPRVLVTFQRCCWRGEVAAEAILERQLFLAVDFKPLQDWVIFHSFAPTLQEPFLEQRNIGQVLRAEDKS